jgi:hypothetical protein
VGHFFLEFTKRLTGVIRALTAEFNTLFRGTFCEGACLAKKGSLLGAAAGTGQILKGMAGALGHLF